jgi:hypothetical protein
VWHFEIVLYYYKYALDGPNDAGNCKTTAKIIGLATKVAATFLEVSKDLGSIDVGVPWHIGSLLCILYCG